MNQSTRKKAGLEEFLTWCLGTYSGFLCRSFPALPSCGRSVKGTEMDWLGICRNGSSLSITPALMADLSFPFPFLMNTVRGLHRAGFPFEVLDLFFNVIKRICLFV